MGKKKCSSECPKRPETCSTSSSTDCGDCHNSPKDDYSESCPPRCCIKDYQGMPAYEIWRKYNSAVVSIHSEFNFTTATDPNLTPNNGLVYGTNLNTVYQHGNGFFITQHMIITSAKNVLAPPDHTLLYNRWPFVANQIDATTLQSNIMTRANRIFVDVFNVNGSSHSYTYQAEIIGVYGFGDLAILYIDRSAQWNEKIPCIKKCHPHFRFACSRKYKTGMEVYAIGDAFTRSLGSTSMVNTSTPLSGNNGHQIISGKVADMRYLDHIGYAQQELMAVDLDVYSNGSGLPLINKFGHVIGMQTLSVAGAEVASNNAANIAINTTLFKQANGDGFVAGPTQYFLLKVIKVILCSLRSRNVDYIETISDPAGDYIRYIHGFLGLAWEVFDGQDFMSVRALNGEIQARFNADGTYNLTPTTKKEVVGLRVAGLTNDTGASTFRQDIYLPGAGAPGSNAPTPWVNSALNVALNDVITHVERCPLGDIGNQIAMALITSRKRVGDTLELQVRTIASGYENIARQVVTLLAAPRFYDFPHYSYKGFPYDQLTLGYLPFAGPLPQDPAVVGTNPVDATRQVPTIPVV